MGRIAEADRLPMVDAHLGHYAEADAINGTPIELVTGFGLPQLQALRAAYSAKALEITQIEDGDLLTLRAERDAIWGINPEDDDGILFRLAQYKALVRAHLGARHPLSRTVPNFGRISVERYLVILQPFIDHWVRVNALLTPRPDARNHDARDFADGARQPQYQADGHRHDGEFARREARRTRTILRRRTGRAARRHSILARLMLYHATIPALFPNQPLADSLPPIFPVGTTPTLPMFEFNYVAQGGGVLKTWFGVASAPSGTTSVLLKEGAVQLIAPLQSSPTGGIQIDLWNGVTLVDDLDDLELRNASGLTLARGVRNCSLPEPT